MSIKPNFLKTDRKKDGLERAANSPPENCPNSKRAKGVAPPPKKPPPKDPEKENSWEAGKPAKPEIFKKAQRKAMLGKKLQTTRLQPRWRGKPAERTAKLSTPTSEFPKKRRNRGWHRATRHKLSTPTRTERGRYREGSKPSCLPHPSHHLHHIHHPRLAYSQTRPRRRI